MIYTTARAIVQDYEAFLKDKTGTALCPNLEQVEICRQILEGKSFPDYPDAVLPYFRPADAPPAAVTISVETSDANPALSDPKQADGRAVHGAVAASHGLALSPAQQADVDNGTAVPVEQLPLMAGFEEPPTEPAEENVPLTPENVPLPPEDPSEVPASPEDPQV